MPPKSSSQDAAATLIGRAACLKKPRKYHEGGRADAAMLSLIGIRFFASSQVSANASAMFELPLEAHRW